MKKIVVDVFGGDAGSNTVIKGVADVLKERDDFSVVMVGDEKEISSLFEKEEIPSARYEIIHTTEYITNFDPPSCVFGGKDETSMVMAYKRLKEDEDCVAMLSPGSTGALLVGSICRLGLVKGLKFPALSSALPCIIVDKLVCLVDCGANCECTAKDLARFAVMGNVFAKSVKGVNEPKVGLLSVGREEGKGTSLTKEAFNLIKELPLNFIGNVEGYDLVTGYADVIVSDGFSGNILLKTAESAGKAAMEIVKELSGDHKELCQKINNKLFKTFDYNSQGGATFLGPEKIVVKMHGSASEETVKACIDQIMILENSGFRQAMIETSKVL